MSGHKFVVRSRMKSYCVKSTVTTEGHEVTLRGEFNGTLISEDRVDAGDIVEIIEEAAVDAPRLRLLESVMGCDGFEIHRTKLVVIEESKKLQNSDTVLQSLLNLKDELVKRAASHPDDHVSLEILTKINSCLFDRYPI